MTANECMGIYPTVLRVHRQTDIFELKSHCDSYCYECSVTQNVFF